MSDVKFTGERLHAGSPLFQVDLARHEAAYRFARERSVEARVLDMGCGSGYGTASLAGVARSIVGVDRIRPDTTARAGAAHYVRADLNGIPLAPGCFDLVVSFQVIEHLVDPSEYLDAIRGALCPTGTALISTPNLLVSDRENPYHVHEYASGELEQCLRGHFEEVEIRGVNATPEVGRYFEARLEQIRRITRLDPFRLRQRLPRGLVEWLFARFARIVRRAIRREEGMPHASWRDFPIGPVTPISLDLLAICREPRPCGSRTRG